MGSIYKIINLINQKIYIGKTTKNIENRFNKHKDNAAKKINRRLYDSMNFYGYDNFNIEEIEYVEDNSHLSKREIYWILFFNSNDPEIGYNMTNGGEGGNTGKYHYGKSPYDWWVEKYGVEKANLIKKDVYERVSIKMKNREGHSQTEETKNKIRNFNIENGIKPPTQYWIDITHPMLGKKHTEESKIKISKTRKDKKYEDLFDLEKTQELKELHKNNWLGEKNPNFKKIDPYEILKYLKEGKNNIEISKILNISVYTLINKFKKEFGVTPSFYNK